MIIFNSILINVIIKRQMHAIFALRMRSDREAIGFNSLIQNAYETNGFSTKGKAIEKR